MHIIYIPHLITFETDITPLLHQSYRNWLPEHHTFRPPSFQHYLVLLNVCVVIFWPYSITGHITACFKWSDLLLAQDTPTHILPHCSVFQPFCADIFCQFSTFFLISILYHFYGTLYNIGWLPMGCIHTLDTYSSSDTLWSFPTLLYFRYSDVLIGQLMLLSFGQPLRPTRRSFQHYSDPSNI